MNTSKTWLPILAGSLLVTACGGAREHDAATSGDREAPVADALSIPPEDSMDPSADERLTGKAPIACGDVALHAAQHQGCAPMDVEGHGACYCALGAYWDGHECTLLLGACECVGEDCDKLFPGMEQCEAATQTCGDATSPAIACGDPALHAHRYQGQGAMDVAGRGECFCFLGVYWNGYECSPLVGACECVGEDCDKLFTSMEECEREQIGR